jgi:MoaA/NifB/PqqE/SkfB family radical SAM enzyme
LEKVNGIDRYSAYNILPDKNQSDHPLLDLLPEDNEHGWHVARNLIKPLNHLSALREKEEIAKKLQLHNTQTPKKIFTSNYKVLEKHQRGEISSLEVVDMFCQQQSQNGGIGRKDILTDLQAYASISHMEFHPSDVCNLTCLGCTYGHDNSDLKPHPIQFPWDQIKNINKLKPKSMVIIGGGEPTLYRDRKYGFQEMVEEIISSNLGIKLALVTNGIFIPAGDWPKWFSWIRVSLDAATYQTYTNIRGKNMFDKVVKNYLTYLKTNVPYVGISFLFSKSNIHEYAKVAQIIYQLVEKEQPHSMHKANIQYRPLRRDPWQFQKKFEEAISFNDIQNTVEEIRELANVSHHVRDFLRNQTNITAVLGGNRYPHHDFLRCYYSQVFKIVRANGELRPCFIRVFEPDFVLGNILSDSLETIAINTLYIAARQKPFCDKYGCRQCHVNYVFEQGIGGLMKPSNSGEVLADSMF